MRFESPAVRNDIQIALVARVEGSSIPDCRSRAGVKTEHERTEVVFNRGVVVNEIKDRERQEIEDGGDLAIVEKPEAADRFGTWGFVEGSFFICVSQMRDLEVL